VRRRVDRRRGFATVSQQLRLAALAAVAVIAAAGCGSQAAASPRAHLIAQADQICKQVATLRAADNKEVHNASTSAAKLLDALTRLAPVAAAYERQAVDRLRTLTVPASLTHDWQEMLAGIQQLANENTELASNAKSKNIKGVQLVSSRSAKERQQLAALATRDGFTYCGRTS
jgi:hypothetical protein